MSTSSRPDFTLLFKLLAGLAAIHGSFAGTALGQGRLFMDGAGAAGANQPTTGNTSIVVSPGSSRLIEVWIVDPHPGGFQLDGYHLMLQCTAVGGPSGTVEYVDNNPGMGGGDTILINTMRSDWVYANQIGVPSPFYAENCTFSLFGVIGHPPFINETKLGEFDNQQAYLAEFEITASADACGLHTLQWNTDATGDPPFTALFRPGGDQWFADTAQTPTVLQHLDVLVDGCTGCDVDEDGIRDDACVWCECVDLCGDATNQIDVIFGDMGGPFGDCAPDGVSDSHDVFHAVNCFANVDVSGNPESYPCEPNAPNALNVDAGGAFGSCSPDGVCDGNDAFHALAAFGGTSSCSCPLDPAPVVDTKRRNRPR